MKITADDLKKDVEMVLDDLRMNYAIPSFFNSFAFLFKVITIVLVVQVCLSVLDFSIWGGAYRGGVREALIVYSVGMLGVLLLPSIVLLIVCYHPLMIMSCLSNEAKRRSVLLNVAKNKFRYVLFIAIVSNLIVGFCFVLNESAMIVFMGGSWFVTIIISTLIYNMLLAPYFTPAVVSSLSKVKELLSASPE